MKARWIQMAERDEEWDAYLDKMEAHGLSEYLEDQTNIFDSVSKAVAEQMTELQPIPM